MWIDEWLFKEGKSVKEVAKKLDITPQHLSQVVCGTRKASSRLALEIEKITKGKVTIREILYKPVPKRGKKEEEDESN